MTSPGPNGNSLITPVLYSRNDVFGAAWPNDRQRANFEDAGVAGIELQRNVVHEHIALQHASQISLNTFLLLVHAGGDACCDCPVERRLSCGRVFGSVLIRTGLRQPDFLLSMPLVNFQVER